MEDEVSVRVHYRGRVSSATLHSAAVRDLAVAQATLCRAIGLPERTQVQLYTWLPEGGSVGGVAQVVEHQIRDASELHSLTTGDLVIVRPVRGRQARKGNDAADDGALSRTSNSESRNMLLGDASASEAGQSLGWDELSSVGSAAHQLETRERSRLTSSSKSLRHVARMSQRALHPVSHGERELDDLGFALDDTPSCRLVDANTGERITLPELVRARSAANSTNDALLRGTPLPVLVPALVRRTQELLHAAAGLREIHFPLHADQPASPIARAFASRDWQTADAVLVLVPRKQQPAGVWSRTLLLGAGLKHGSMLPFVLRARMLNVAVVLADPLSLRVAEAAGTRGESTTTTPSSSSSDAQYAALLGERMLARSRGKLFLVVMGDSAPLWLRLLGSGPSRTPGSWRSRVAATALLESTHQVRHVPASAWPLLVDRTIVWRAQSPAKTHQPSKGDMPPSAEADEARWRSQYGCGVVALPSPDLRADDRVPDDVRQVVGSDVPTSAATRAAMDQRSLSAADRQLGRLLSRGAPTSAAAAASNSGAMNRGYHNADTAAADDDEEEDAVDAASTSEVGISEGFARPRISAGWPKWMWRALTCARAEEGVFQFFRTVAALEQGKKPTGDANEDDQDDETTEVDDGASIPRDLWEAHQSGASSSDSGSGGEGDDEQGSATPPRLQPSPPLRSNPHASTTTASSRTAGSTSTALRRYLRRRRATPAVWVHGMQSLLSQSATVQQPPSEPSSAGVRPPVKHLPTHALIVLPLVTEAWEAAIRDANASTNTNTEGGTRKGPLPGSWAVDVLRHVLKRRRAAAGAEARSVPLATTAFVERANGRPLPEKAPQWLSRTPAPVAGGAGSGAAQRPEKRVADASSSRPARDRVAGGSSWASSEPAAQLDGESETDDEEEDDNDNDQGEDGEGQAATKLDESDLVAGSGGRTRSQTGPAHGPGGPAVWHHGTPYCAPPLMAPRWQMRVDHLVRELMQLRDSATAWVHTGRSLGVDTFMPTDSIPGSRGESWLPYPPAAVLRILLDDDKQAEQNELVDSVTVQERLNDQGAIVHSRYKPVAFTAPRDFFALVHWRVQPSGLAVIVTASVDDADFPDTEGYVRGRIHLGGWILVPSESDPRASSDDPTSAVPPSLAQLTRLGESQEPGEGPVPTRGTYSIFISRIDLGGYIPTWLVRSAMGQLAQAPRELRKQLDRYFVDGVPLECRLLPANFSPEDARKDSHKSEEGDEGEEREEGEARPQSEDEEGGGEEEQEEQNNDDIDDDDEIDVGGGVLFGEESGAIARGGLLGEGAGADLAWLPGEEPPTDLSGVWKVDSRHSDSLEPLFAALDVPRVARDVAQSVESTTTIATFSGGVTLEMTSSFGTARQDIIPDGVLRQTPAQSSTRAAAAASSDGRRIRAAYRQGPAPGDEACRGWGYCAPILWVQTVLPRQQVVLVEERWLLRRKRCVYRISVWKHRDPSSSAMRDTADRRPLFDDEEETRLAQERSEAAREAVVFGMGDLTVRGNQRSVSAVSSTRRSRQLASAAASGARAVSVDSGGSGGVKSGMEDDKNRDAEKDKEGGVEVAWDLHSVDSFPSDADSDPAHARVTTTTTTSAGAAGGGGAKSGASSSSSSVGWPHQRTQTSASWSAPASKSALTMARAWQCVARVTQLLDKEETAAERVRARRLAEEAPMRRQRTQRHRRQSAVEGVPGAVPPVDLSGTWRTDPLRAQGMAVFMREMGIPTPTATTSTDDPERWSVTSHIVQTSTEMVLEDTSQRGKRRAVYALDGRVQRIRVSGGTVLETRAHIEPGDGSDDFSGVGPNAPTVVVVTYLPAPHSGVVLDERQLESRTLMRWTTKIERDGEEKARMTRYLVKQETEDEAQWAVRVAEAMRQARKREAAMLSGEMTPSNESLAGLRSSVRQLSTGSESGPNGSGGRGDAKRRDLRAVSEVDNEDEETEEEGRSHRARSRMGGHTGTSFGSFALRSRDGSRRNASLDEALVEQEQQREGQEKEDQEAAEDNEMPMDLSGVWAMDQDRSESSEPVLQAMGLPWLLRKFADRIRVTSTVTQDNEVVAIRDTSSVGEVHHRFILDGQWHEAKGGDGKPVQQKSEVLWDPRNGNVSGWGEGAPVLRVITVLGNNGGTITDDRWLESRTTMVMRTSFSKGGSVLAEIQRYLVKQESEQEREDAERAAEQLQRKRRAKKQRRRQTSLNRSAAAGSTNMGSSRPAIGTFLQDAESLPIRAITPIARGIGGLVTCWLNRESCAAALSQQGGLESLEAAVAGHPVQVLHVSPSQCQVLLLVGADAARAAEIGSGDENAPYSVVKVVASGSSATDMPSSKENGHPVVWADPEVDCVRIVFLGSEHQVPGAVSGAGGAADTDAGSMWVEIGGRGFPSIAHMEHDAAAHAWRLFVGSQHPQTVPWEAVREVVTHSRWVAEIRNEESLDSLLSDAARMLAMPDEEDDTSGPQAASTGGIGLVLCGSRARRFVHLKALDH